MSGAGGGGMKDQDRSKSLAMVMMNHGQSDDEWEKLYTHPFTIAR
jgi:hypothetical protein